MRFEFCPFCGTKTVLKKIGDEGDSPYCEKCSRPLFDMFSTCVLNVVVNEDKEVLLIRQSYGDTSRYVGVAGFMKVGETPEEAGAREVLEETGLTRRVSDISTAHFTMAEISSCWDFLHA